jgi:hypothetical protein
VDHASLQINPKVEISRTLRSQHLQTNTIKLHAHIGVFEEVTHSMRHKCLVTAVKGALRSLMIMNFGAGICRLHLCSRLVSVAVLTIGITVDVFPQPRGRF